MTQPTSATTNPDPAQASATQGLAALRAGTLTAEAWARACLRHTAKREPVVQAWAHLDAAQVLAQARALDAVAPAARGPLHGVPVGIKDVILTADMPTQYNAAPYRGYAPAVDAACVSLLRQAGAIVFGKTQTVEFAATGRVAPTTNPHHAGHTPGGSSSGSAAAVADGHVPLALGTQTGGSIVRPASYCGVWALKPTWGLVSREGAKLYATSLDTIGWFGRSAADLALLLSVFDPDAPGPAALRAEAPFDLAGARIAVCRSAAWPQAEPATRDALQFAADRLTAAGAQVEPLDLPPPFDTLGALHDVVMRGEGRSALLSEYRLHHDALHPSLRGQVENVAGYSRAQLLDAYDTAAACRATFDRLAADYAAVLTPSTTGAAPAGLAHTGSLAFNAMWSLLHVPCVNVPGLHAAGGLPVGLTVTGPRYADAQVLRVAAAIGALLADPAPVR